MGSVHSSTFPREYSTKTASLNNSLLRPMVCTQKGPVQGRQLKLKDGRIVNVFLGIPFAKPPIGALRFKKPEEPDPWGPIPLQTRRYKARAIQRDFIWDSVELGGVPKSEDCLYLNVVSPGWTPPSPGGWPVMVFIHGGGFMIDSAVKYHYAKVAQNLARHGVIVVTMNYRLGLLGFFCTGDEECPGNLGLWDQLFALRWVHSNIGAFGGNLQRITLFGHSAGAASADLLSLSPLSRDLFQQVILMGGSAETIWAVSSKEILVVYCRKKAVKMGFRRKESAEWGREENGRMMEFLRNLPATKFELTLLGDRTIIDEIRLAVSPVIDGELLPKSPKELRAEIAAPKPMICGQSQHEGLLFLALGMRRANGKFLAYCEQRLVEMLKEAKRRIEAQKMDGNLVPSAEEITELYGIGQRKGMPVAIKQRACVTIMSDLVNNLAMHNLARLTLAKQNAPRVWRFILEHFNADASVALNPLFPFKGSTHGNELHYIFGINFFVVPWRRTEADKAVLEMMTKFWTNFAKFGDPNGPSEGQGVVRWEPSTPECVERHLNIVAWESAMRDKNEDSERVQRLGEVYRALVH